MELLGAAWSCLELLGAAWSCLELLGNGNGANAKSGANKSFFVAAYGFEGFAKTAAESGINVSDRALPVVCEITRGVMTEDGTAEADTRIRYDIFAETDMIIYLTADGQMSTRI